MRNAVQFSSPPPTPLQPSRAWALAPMLSGARARGFADGLEWLGLAAALIDDRGETLHLNAGAVEALGGDLYLDEGRLRAVDPALDAELSKAIVDTLTTGATGEIFVTGRRSLSVRIVAVEPAGDDPCQLMRAVALFRSAASA